MSTPNEIVETLAMMGVTLELRSKSVVLKSVMGNPISKEAVELAKPNKQLLLEHLISKCVHLPPFDYANRFPDKYGRPGFEMLVCPECGRLIGYRQIEELNQGGRYREAA